VKVRVVVTQQFKNNLDRIASWFDERGAGTTVDALLRDLDERVIPLLKVTPRIGPTFRDATTLTAESRFVLERLAARLGGKELRQWVRSDFMILYLVSGRTVYLVGARHHRQATFTLG
jgi:hypothetical protein